MGANRRRGAFSRPPEGPRRRPPKQSSEADERKEPTMRPVRAFFLSFAAGLAVLFSGHGLVTVALADPPTGSITV